MEKLKASVEEFTTPDPITTTELATIEEMAKLMKQNGIRHLPIMKNQEVVGIVSERDLNLVASLDIPGKQFCAKDIMAK
ncbi:MAG: CBS domain-containing protein, partial [Pseudobdellovibrionaceae bacterium]